MFLQPQFLEKYGNYAENQSAISKFTYLRTYSRYLPQLGRREHWKETAKRAVDFSLSLEYNHRRKLGLPIDFAAMREEAEELFDSMFNLKQFVSGRTLWVGGAEGGLAEKFALANFNCSFTNVSEPNDLADIFYVLLVGTGAGLKANKKLLEKFPAVKRDFELVHMSYEYIGEPGKLEDSVFDLDIAENTVYITVGDSKEGWVTALKMFFTAITSKAWDVKKIVFRYDYVRPAGTRLKTFGGTASGHTPLQEMFEGFRKAIQNEIDPTLDPIEVDEDGYGKLRPIHILDMSNLIGYNVVVGGVRRTAEIILGDEDDYEFIFAKYGMNGLFGEEAFERHEEVGRLLEVNGIPKPKWFDEIGVQNWDENVTKDGKMIPFNYGRYLPHRSMSNNSIAFTKKPTRDKLHLVFAMMKGEGEPGFVNLREMAVRRLEQLGYSNPSEYLIEQMMLVLGMNPCAEINLRSKGVCNLSTVNVKSFVYDFNGTKILDEEGLLAAQRLSARIGLRMTLIELELPEWDKTQQQDRLTGNSLTGWKDAMDEVNYGKGQQRRLLKALRSVARSEADLYAKELRVNAPLLTTTVKPEGTQSILGNAVSSGLHHSHSPYYIRRIRINAHDPLAKAVIAMGWNVKPENFTPGNTEEERMANARTLVISFPVASGAKRTKDDITVDEQLQTYFDFQKYYAEHNSSNTITIKDDVEWNTAEDVIYEKWDEFTAVSFLALDGGTYEQTPYEAITKEQYEEMAAAMPEFDDAILAQFENPGEDFDVTDADCATGACPVR